MDIVIEVADEINQHDALHDSHMLAFICIWKITFGATDGWSSLSEWVAWEGGMYVKLLRRK